MKIKVIKYDLDTSNEKDAQEYQKIQEYCLSLGYKFFKYISDGNQSTFYKNMPEVQTIETDFLFNDQYNTDYGRIHDWSETIYPNRHLKCGYYIEPSDELKAAKENQLACGYCGKRYNAKETALKFCNACLHSEYLTEDRLYMLKLVPVFKDKINDKNIRPKEIPAELLEEFNNLGAKLEELRRERLKKKAVEITEDMMEKHEKERYENSVKVALLFNGIDTENLIYYSHRGEWVYGWYKPVTKEQFEEFRAKCEAIEIPEDKDGIAFINLLSKGK